MKEPEYYAWLGGVFNKAPHVIIHYAEQLYKYAISINTPPNKTISWVYNSNTPKQHREIGFFGIDPDFKRIGQPYKNPNDKRVAKLIREGNTARLYDWWHINQVKNVSVDKTDHPCQMPIKVMENIIGTLDPNLTIVDPFMGSGTTGVACKNLNRDFIGIEIDVKYFEIADARINNFEFLL